MEKVMKMSIATAPDFSYSTAASQFLIDIFISSDVPLEVSSDINVSGALLTRVGEKEALFGYVQRVSPAKRDFITLSAEAPLHLRIDVFEYENDLQGLLPADYRCDVKVDVLVKNKNNFEHEELRDSLVVSLI
jgi:hypothetical protein